MNLLATVIHKAKPNGNSEKVVHLWTKAFRACVRDEAAALQN